MFDAFKIGILLSLNNHVSPGLRVLAKDFAGTDAQAAALQKRINNLQNTALKGGLYFGLGAGMLALFKGPLEEAKKFDQAIGKFKLFGMSEAQNADAIKFARSMNTMGTSYVENLKLMTEAQGVFRESGMAGPAALEGAKLAAPMLAKIQFATAGLDDESQAKMKTQGLAMLRYVEMSGGLQSAEKFNEIANAGFKLIQTSGGNVNWEQLRQYKARASVSGMGITDEGMAALEPIIGELKGSTAGFGSKTAYNRLNGVIKVPNQAAHMMVDAGIWDNKKIEWNSMGGIKRFLGDDGPMKKQFAEILDATPAQFYKDVMLPAYAKMHGGKGLNQRERYRENAMIFGGTGGANFSLVDKQMAAIEKSIISWKKALGIDESVKTAGETMAGKELKLEANWKKFQQTLGEVILPMAISGIEKLNGVLTSLTGWMDRNHEIAKDLTYAFIILAGGLMLRGTLLMLSAAFRGLGVAMAFKKAGGATALFGDVNNGLGGVSGVLGKLGMVAQALVVGWMVGTVLYDTAIAGTKFADVLGMIEAKFLKFLGFADAAKALDENGKAVDPVEHQKKRVAEFEAENARRRQFGFKQLSPSEFNQAHPDQVAKPAPYTEEKRSWMESTARWILFPSVAGADAAQHGAVDRATPPSDVKKAGAAPATTADHAQLAAVIGDVMAAKLNGASVKMDGTTVGNLVIGQMGRESMAPSTGTSFFDSRMTPTRPDS
jgi:hypothetical protein